MCPGKESYCQTESAFTIEEISHTAKNLKSIKFQKTFCCSVMGLGPNVPALEQPGKKLRKNSPSHLPCLRFQVEAFSSKYLVFILLQTFSSLCFTLRLCVGWLQVLKYIEQNKSKSNASHLKYLDFCILNSVIFFCRGICWMNIQINWVKPNYR